MVVNGGIYVFSQIAELAAPPNSSSPPKRGEEEFGVR